MGAHPSSEDPISHYTGVCRDEEGKWVATKHIAEKAEEQEMSDLNWGDPVKFVGGKLEEDGEGGEGAAGFVFRS